MHLLLLLLLLLLPFFIAAPAAPNVLTPQNFEQTIANGVWFIEYFSPYCRHCRNFEPTWNDLVNHFEAISDSGVHLAQVNCALNGDLCNENGISGYPQMNLYRDGEFVDAYNGDREFHLLVEYIGAHTKPLDIEETTTEPTPTPTSTPTPTPTPSPETEPLLVQTTRSDANPSGTVVALDVQTFDSYLQQRPAFIKFYAPWCGHCKKLAPTWAQLGRRMQHKLNIAEVDCEQHKALCTSQGVTAFPTLFFYAHGVKTEYTSGRSYDQLVAFADKAANPNMQVIDASDLTHVVTNNDVVYLLLHDASDHRIVTDIAKATQSLLGSPPIYVSTSSDLFHTYNLAPPSAILAFKDKDAREPVSTFLPTSQSSDALSAWLYANRFPTSMELSKDVFQQVMYAPHHPLVLIVSTPKEQQEAVSSKLHEIAQKWRLRARAANTARDVVFTWMDATQWAKWMKDMYGVRSGTEPEIIVADHERLLYYNKDGSGHAIALNSVSVGSALEAILAGTAPPRHSQNVVERGVQSLNSGLIRVERWIVTHPYMTVLAILGLIGLVVLALRSLLVEEPIDWEAEKRYNKRGRLD